MDNDGTWSSVIQKINFKCRFTRSKQSPLNNLHCKKMAIRIRKQEVCIATGQETLHKTCNYLRTSSSNVLKNSKNQNINKFTIR